MSGDRPKLRLRDEPEPKTPVSPAKEKTELEKKLASIQRQKTIAEQPFSGGKTARRKGLPKAGNVLMDRGKRRISDISEVWDDLEQGGLYGDDRPLFSSDVLADIADKFRSFTSGIGARFGAKRTSQRRADQSRRASQKRFSLGPVSFQRKHALIAVFVVFVAFFMFGRGGGSETGSDSTNNGARNAVRGSATNQSDESQSVPDDELAVIGRETDFELVFPPSLTKEDTGIAVVSPPDAPDPVYAYNDTVEDALLSVSQQEIPDAFQPDVQTNFENLAASFAATEKIVTNENVTVFHGYTDKNDGVQSLMFMKNDLLIFISSTEKLADGIWSDYVDSFSYN